jgi:hypothetical protein
LACESVSCTPDDCFSEVGLSGFTVIHDLNAVLLEILAVIKESLSKVSNPVSIIFSEVLFNLFFSVGILKALKCLVDGILQNLGTIEKFHCFRSKGSTQLLEIFEIDHFLINIIVDFDLISQFVLELSDFSLLLILCSLASPSAEEVLPEAAASDTSVFFLFLFDVDSPFFNFLLDIGFDCKDDVIEVIRGSDTVFLELINCLDDWVKLLTGVLKISDEGFGFILPDFNIVSWSQFFLILLSQE